MDSNLEKRYCKHRIKKPRKNTKKHYSNIDDEQKDERQFKLERFVKDVQAFRNYEQSKKKNVDKHVNDADEENNFNNKNKLQKNHQQSFVNREIVVKDKVKRKRGLFDYGHMTSSFTRGLLGGPNNARFDQDLRKIIGLANLNKSKTNNKPETEISKIHNELTEQEDSPSIHNEIDLGACSTGTTILNIKESKKESPSLGKESYPEFTRLINQTLALEKYKSFENENYAKDIKIRLRNIYLKRLKESQSEESLSIKNSFSNISPVSLAPLIPSQEYDKENYFHNKEMNVIPRYKSTTEYLKETLGVGSSSPFQKSPEVKHSPYIRPNFGKDKLKFNKPNTLNIEHSSLQNYCCVEHIKHPVSKLPFPQEYLQTSSRLHKTSPVLCLPHPAAKFLDSQYVRPLYSQFNSYGKQTSREIIDGCGDRLHQQYQSSPFPLPPTEPSPEFQHYPFQMF